MDDNKQTAALDELRVSAARLAAVLAVHVEAVKELLALFEAGGGS